MANNTKMELGEVKALAAMVARRVRTTPGLGALNAWSAAVHGVCGDESYVAEVDRTWPIVRWDLQAAEQDRPASCTLWWYSPHHGAWQPTTAKATEQEANHVRRMGYATRICLQMQGPQGQPTDEDMALVRQAGG